MAGVVTLAALPSPADQVRTNWVERWITNQVQVTVPANRFVTEFHTNTIIKTETNYVHLFTTNIVTRTETKQVLVDQFRTNIVLAYQTNYKTFHATNFTTVLVLKTNWVQQTVTNVAEVDLPATGRQPAAAVAVAKPESKPAVPSNSDALVLEAARGTRATEGNQADVRISARWSNRQKGDLLVQQWKVQSQEGSVLCFGQESEFHRSLPYGNYKVELKARLAENSPVVTVRGVLVVSAAEIGIDQNSLARK